MKAAIALISLTVLFFAQGGKYVMCDNAPLYDEHPAPTSKVILVSCEYEVQLEIASKKNPWDKKWFLRFTPDGAGQCLVEKMNPVDRSIYQWRRASLPVEISSIGQQFVIITPEEFSNGGWLWVGSQ